MAVDAPIDLRYERVMGRGRPGDRVTLEQFTEQEKRQLSGGAVEQNLLHCIGQADIMLINDTTEEALREELLERMKGYGIDAG